VSGTETYVVVGGGLAAAKAVEALRTGGFTGRVVLLGAERHLPYERPPLSKGYLLDEQELEEAFVQPPQWYADHDIELRLGSPVTALDPDAHTVRSGDGTLGYDRLLIATGATPRRLAAVESGGPPVAYLRTLEDSTRIKDALLPGRRVVVVGGGWIGLEVAAAARTAGCDVVVLEALELPLARVLGPEVAAVLTDLHRERGVDVRTGVAVAGVEGDTGSGAVRLGDGTVLPADLVVVGVGVVPDDALARQAGLETDNGILVDDQLRTSRPDVWAAGDVANAFHPRLGRHVRVEHWDNAIEQGAAAGRNMLGGGESYDRLPYFFTDQYDLGMEYVGHVGPDGYDEVILRGDVAGRVFTAFWVREGRVIAGMHANDWDAIDPVRSIVTAGAVDLTALRDASVPWAELTG
jgi:3-phenylpropionate/trans-cinnamate dioxygenase ferredoxin reductase subunit